MFKDVSKVFSVVAFLFSLGFIVLSCMAVAKNTNLPSVFALITSTLLSGIFALFVYQDFLEDKE